VANLKAISQVAYDQVFPNASPQAAIKVEHFIEVAKTRYAFEMFLLSKQAKATEGEWEIPSSLWREAQVEIVDNRADISGLKIFRSLDGETWLANIGGISGDCHYMKLTANLAQLFSEDDFGNAKPFYVLGKSIIFPLGTHAKKLPIVYASSGEDINDAIEVDEVLGDLVSDYLWKRFSGRIPEDKTQNSNSNK
jgi:hypothetical protein